MKKTGQIPGKDAVSCTPFPGSEKIFLPGSIHPGLQVAMRAINLADTKLSSGSTQSNPPVIVYDTSGPYTDPCAEIDIRKGLPRTREQWILDRNDVERLQEVSSDYGRQRQRDDSLSPLRFEHLKNPLRAKPGKNVSQLHYAKQGIITPEMEYIAIRENQGITSGPDW